MTVSPFRDLAPCPPYMGARTQGDESLFPFYIDVPFDVTL